MGWKLAVFILLVAACFAPNDYNPLVFGAQKYKAYLKEHSTAPKKDYPWHGLTNIWTEDEAAKLLSMVKGLGTYSTFKEDITSVKVDHPEAQPVDPATGGCLHPYLMLNANATECVFPERVDVARHFLTYGGWSSWKENYNKLTSRLQGFQKMFHTADPKSASIPEFETLFQSKQYLDAASSACDGKDVFDPIQLGVIVQVPGQEVPMHYDVPWFLGATRFTLPQWLLVAMDQSDLFKDIRIPQIQGVAYLHRWDPLDPANGGGFFFYPKGNNEEPVLYPARFNNAIVVDGAVVVHGTEPFRPHLSDNLPFIDKSFKHELTFQPASDNWVMNKVKRDGTRESLGTFETTDLRISLVWRARCFSSQEELQKWHNISEHLTLDQVINTFVKDLRARGLVPKDSTPEPFDLALLILNEYVQYPVLEKNPLKQHNFCLLPSLYPSLKPVIDLICG